MLRHSQTLPSSMTEQSLPSLILCINDQELSSTCCILEKGLKPQQCLSWFGKITCGNWCLSLIFFVLKVTIISYHLGVAAICVEKSDCSLTKIKISIYILHKNSDNIRHTGSLGGGGSRKFYGGRWAHIQFFHQKYLWGYFFSRCLSWTLFCIDEESWTSIPIVTLFKYQQT